MKKIIYIVSALALMAGSSSCVGSLDQYPHSTSTSNDVYTSAEGYQQVLSGIYAAFIQRISSVSSEARSQNYLRTLTMFQDCSTDSCDPIWLSGETLTDVNGLSWTASNPWCSAMYYHIYNIVAMCNDFISSASNEELLSEPVSLQANETKSVQLCPVRVDDPELWWPAGYGAQYLYDAEMSFETDGTVSDADSFKLGIREMTYDDADGSLDIYVNGRRLIGNGGNWGFPEVNYNYRAREYDIAVAYHADMGFTLIRNWVGQTGDEEFYEACDRHGVMVWQDFWLANPYDGPDPYYEDMFIDNAADYVLRIRNHPSIALYCGRNEGMPPVRVNEALEDIVAEYHPDIHYIPHSADITVSGYGPYRALGPDAYFELRPGRTTLHSERGMPNVLTYEGFKRTYSPEGMWPQSHEWGMHDYTLEGAQGATSFNEIIAKGYGEPQNAKEFAELAQWVNYDGHRSLFESRSKNRMGLLMWMSHSCWPSMVWQTYDYYLEPTAAYFAIKKASEPLHIQWNPATDEVEVVNYSAGTRNNLTAKVQILNMDGSVAWEKTATVNSREDTTEKCIRLEFPENLSQVHFLKLWLTENGNVVSDNFYHRSLEENNYQALKQLPQVSLNCQSEASRNEKGDWTATVTLENPASVPALMIRVNVTGDKDGDQFLPILYSDNYFALLPKEKKVITIRWKDVDTRGNNPTFNISGYNVKEISK